VVCKRCHTEKPAAGFHFTDKAKTKRDSTCKPCRHRLTQEGRRGKFAAQRAVQNAVKRGILVRGACEQCGATEDVQGHHEDYERKLDVRWLCQTCHRREHPRPWGVHAAA
jgi:hypothetical protein